MQRHQSFLIHAFATSICSSVGQLFIFSTIEEFGPVIFTIIMTIRQAFSILLSCLFYGHHLNCLHSEWVYLKLLISIDVLGNGDGSDGGQVEHQGNDTCSW
ncbi:unnamed protein product [Rotaria sp. Silwood1]|nr:unnamed protein product [Rotaria sp. Silwood1]